MAARRIVIVGGGAAGFFAAIAAARVRSELDVCVLERGPEFLSKVRISGGGRCNVTHAATDARALAACYPRGARELLGPFHRFGPADTIAWFERESVALKTEADGRMFPTTDSSMTVVRCLVDAAEAAGVKLSASAGVERVAVIPTGGFAAALHDGETLECDRLMLATGGCRSRAGARLAEMLGHTIEPPVPSLFTFHSDTAWLRELAGVSVVDVEIAVEGTSLRERGALLVTHWGVSGPVVLKLSAFCARELAARGYRFTLAVHWLPDLDAESVTEQLLARRELEPNRLVVNGPLGSLPARLWRALVLAAGVAADTRWNNLARAGARAIAQQLTAMPLAIAGKSLNKDEFVTCGGVGLKDVDFRTMESKLTPGLYFGGEVLDIDGITGGFNFQAAWTTGWIAGHAMAEVEPQRTPRTDTAE